MARLAFVVSQTECGWDAITTQWYNAAFAWTGMTASPVIEREPVEQARYWMAAVERVAQENPDSAALTMGAAWMLDSPSPEFMQHHMRQADVAAVMPQLGLELDEDSISKGKAQFRRITLEKCINLAARATQLEPDDSRWWRMRALLLFEGDSLWSGQEFAPRTKGWLEVLDDCIAHDGDNALYDYLAALTLWNESASYDWPTTGNDERWILSVKDKERFDLGTKRFLDGQERKYLAIGEDGFPCIVEFLSTYGVGKQVQSDAAVGRLVTFRQSTLFLHLWRWQQARADAASRNNDAALALATHRQSLLFFDQAILPPETSALNVLTTFASLRTSVFDALEKLAAKGPSLMPPGEMERVQGRERELRIETATLTAALQELERQNHASNKEVSFPSIAATVTIASSFVLLFAGVVLLTIGTLLGSSSSPLEELGIVRQSLIWLVGCGGTFIVLGMAPAEVISRTTQTRAIIVGIWLVALAIVGLAVWLVAALLRQRKLRFRVTALFGAMTGVAVLAALWPLIAAACSGIVNYPPELWLHARGWNGVDPEVLRSAMRIDSGSWIWATIQWFAFNGLYVGLVLSLALSGLWLIWLTARRARSSTLNYWTREVRQRWLALSRSLGKTSLYASAWMLFLYLCFAPQFVREAEAQFQSKLSYCRDPLAHWEKIRDAQRAIKASPIAMKPILEQVEFQLGDDEVLEQDFTTPSR
jgi:MFS family permease